MDDDYSIVEYFGEDVSDHCGYCKSTVKDKYSHGMWSHVLTVQDYQDLLDRGWRRSGKYTYKPTMHRTCCPLYTIRCRALEFVPSKSQRRAARKFVNYLKSGQMSKQWIPADQALASNDQSKLPVASSKINKPSQSSIGQDKVKKEQSQYKEETMKPTFVQNSQAVKGVDTNKPKCTKAKFKRRERWRQKLIDKGVKPEDIDSYRKKPPPIQTVEEILNFEDIGESPAHKFQLKLVACNERNRASINLTLPVFQTYQTIIHKDKSEENTMKEFAQFLIDTPLKFKSGPLGHPGYGSFHQQYILDDKIIGVGVMDILPDSVSSKYFYYDPKFQFLNLGVISALNEIALVRQLSKFTPALKYYYMGLYVHACQKMRYKGCYTPSDLLCPEAYTWHPIKECTHKLDVNKYSKFNEDYKGPQLDDDVSDVLILHNRTVYTYDVYKSIKRGNDDEEEVREYSNLVGAPAKRSLLLYRD